MSMLHRLHNSGTTLIRKSRSIKQLRVSSTALYHSNKGVYGHNPQCDSVGYDNAQTYPFTQNEIENRIEHANVVRLVNAYHTHGHKKALLDPLNLKEQRHVPELDASMYGLQNLAQAVPTNGIISVSNGASIKLDDLIQKLETTYCSALGAEFNHLHTEEERLWFSQQLERRHETSMSAEEQVHLAKVLLKCQAFDNFVGTKFATVKRYAGEGGESMMAFFDEILKQCSKEDIGNVVMAMPHRGRLNFMACLLNFPPVIIFRKMKGLTELPPGATESGDILSHLFTSVDLSYEENKVHVSLIPNPSHLEANDPVAAGKARSKLQSGQIGHYSSSSGAQSGNNVLCLQVHGDASFAGQGLIAEMFCFTEAPHFHTGGNIHLIVNNQVGYTTEGDRGRSSMYCSDIAKMNGYPVLHVNGDNPQDVKHAARIAMEYRAKFRRDVVIDLVCYRRWGHNEVDEPSFTQPRMYNVINNRTSVPDLYAKQVVSAGLCGEQELSDAVQNFNLYLTDHLNQVPTYENKPFHLQGQWSNLGQAGDNVTTWDTGVSVDLLKYIGAKSVSVPSDMKIHPTLQRGHVDKRLKSLTEGTDIDWATAEAMAMGSLLCQGFQVRISGQDVGRGTFSQRHCMLVDQESDHIYIPLNDISESQSAFLEVANSVLSEEAVLGFEYGFSIDKPDALVIWEAQFGDFFNTAQSIIDTYVTSGELKWLLQSGLVMVLPNGMDGAGPEHSSCRLERFLQQCDSKEDQVDGDNVNFQIVYPTTSAQYFHLLRRQMMRNYRKPLVVSGPKTLLRLPAAASSLEQMSPGTSFLPVLPDNGYATPAEVTKVVFCSGKHYYLLAEEREKRSLTNVAIVRLESLCPFPTSELQSIVQLYPQATEFVWSQEEHRNMGAWTFVSPRFANLVGCRLKYAGRKVLGAPAVGIGEVHKKEIVDMVEQTFA